MSSSTMTGVLRHSHGFGLCPATGGNGWPVRRLAYPRANRFRRSVRARRGLVRVLGGRLQLPAAQRVSFPALREPSVDIARRQPPTGAIELGDDRSLEGLM